MAKKIAWTEQAKADVRATDGETAIHILHGLARFLETRRRSLRAPAQGYLRAFGRPEAGRIAVKVINVRFSFRSGGRNPGPLIVHVLQQ